MNDVTTPTLKRFAPLTFASSLVSASNVYLASFIRLNTQSMGIAGWSGRFYSRPICPTVHGQRVTVDGARATVDGARWTGTVDGAR